MTGYMRRPRPGKHPESWIWCDIRRSRKAWLRTTSALPKKPTSLANHDSMCYHPMENPKTVGMLLSCVLASLRVAEEVRSFHARPG